MSKLKRSDALAFKLHNRAKFEEEPTPENSSTKKRARDDDQKSDGDEADSEDVSKFIVKKAKKTPEQIAQKTALIGQINKEWKEYSADHEPKKVSWAKELSSEKSDAEEEPGKKKTYAEKIAASKKSSAAQSSDEGR